MKKQVKSFSEFTKRKLNEDYYGDGSEFEQTSSKGGGIYSNRIPQIRYAFEFFNGQNPMDSEYGVDIDALEDFLLNSPIGKRTTFDRRDLKNLYARFLDLYRRYEEGEIAENEYHMGFEKACERVFGKILGY